MLGKADKFESFDNLAKEMKANKAAKKSSDGSSFLRDAVFGLFLGVLLHAIYQRLTNESKLEENSSQEVTGEEVSSTF